MIGCSDCSRPLSKRNRTGKCRSCCAKGVGSARRLPPVHCSGCGKQLTKSTTGLCRTCFNTRLNADPAVSAKRSAGISAWAKANPAAASRRAKKGAEARLSQPGALEQLQHLVRTRVQPLACTPEAIARRDKAKRGDALSRAKLPWCPPEWREEYRRLRRKQMTVDEAKAIILAEIKRREAALTPFERQMRALERGKATIVEFRERPSLARPGYAEAKRA